MAKHAVLMGMNKYVCLCVCVKDKPAVESGNGSCVSQFLFFIYHTYSCHYAVCMRIEKSFDCYGYQDKL